MIRYYRMALLCLILSVLLAVPASAGCYRYVDDNGIVHYTDEFNTIPEKYQLQIEPDPEPIARQEVKKIRTIEATDSLSFPETPTTVFKTGESVKLKTSDTKRENPPEASLPAEAQPPLQAAEPTVDSKQDAEIKKLVDKRKTLLEKKKVLDTKFDTLLEEKKQIEAGRENLDDEKRVAEYNEHIKQLNEKIKEFKKEEEALSLEIKNYNESIPPQAR